MGDDTPQYFSSSCIITHNIWGFKGERQICGILRKAEENFDRHLYLRYKYGYNKIKSQLLWEEYHLSLIHI